MGSSDLFSRLRPVRLRRLAGRAVVDAAPLMLAVLLQGCVPLAVGGAVATTAVVHDRRPAGTVLEDQSNEFSVRRRINSDAAFAEGKHHINITSYNNVVLLTGEVPDREAGLRARELARSVKNVRQVHNELVIAPPSSLSQRSKDTLITTGVKSNLLMVDLPGFDPTRVTVVTERAVVYLFGLLNRAEAEQVTERARQVQGVQRVVRLFELTD